VKAKFAMSIALASGIAYMGADSCGLTGAIAGFLLGGFLSYLILGARPDSYRERR